MGEKKLVTILAELSATLVVLYAQDKTSRAEILLMVHKSSGWIAEKFGRLSMAAELKYRQEVSP